MSSFMDWFLNKTRLVELENEEISEDQEPEYIDKTWLEIIPWRKDQESEKKRSVFFKNILTYDDGKAVIENYKRGAVCIFLFNQTQNPDAQGMMNYICGGIYALDGTIADLGENVYIAFDKTVKYCL